MIEGNALIGNNRATDGGGIALYLATCMIRGNAQIQGNSAWDDGGGVYGSHAAITFSENAQLVNNTSLCGGGLCTEHESFTIVQDQTVVRGNKATGNAQGAAVYVWA